MPYDVRIHSDQLLTTPQERWNDSTKFKFHVQLYKFFRNRLYQKTTLSTPYLFHDIRFYENVASHSLIIGFHTQDEANQFIRDCAAFLKLEKELISFNAVFQSQADRYCVDFAPVDLAKLQAGLASAMKTYTISRIIIDPEKDELQRKAERYLRAFEAAGGPPPKNVTNSVELQEFIAKNLDLALSNQNRCRKIFKALYWMKRSEESYSPSSAQNWHETIIKEIENLWGASYTSCIFAGSLSTQTVDDMRAEGIRDPRMGGEPFYARMFKPAPTPAKSSSSGEEYATTDNKSRLPPTNPHRDDIITGEMPTPTAPPAPLYPQFPS